MMSHMLHEVFGFVGLAQFQHCAASFLLSCKGTFDSSCIQSLDTITILTYGAATKEQQYESRTQLRHKKCSAALNIYLRECERKGDIDVLERIILM